MTGDGGPTDVLPFKDGFAAFDYACKYLDTKVKKGKYLFALVAPWEDSTKPVGIDERGIQTCIIRVAGDKGGFETVAQTLGPGPCLLVGDAVGWVPMKKFKGLWMGPIVAKLEPELSISQGWKIEAKYEP